MAKKSLPSEKNLPYQQNLERLPLTIFVLNAKGKVVPLE